MDTLEARLAQALTAWAEGPSWSAPPRPVQDSLADIEAVDFGHHSLTEIRGLQLNTQRVEDGHLDLLSRLLNLDSLNLCDTLITNASAPRLKAMKALSTLGVSGQWITDDVVPEIAQMNLGSVTVAQSALTDAGISKLAQHFADKELYHLSIAGSKGTDVSMEQVSKITSLRHLVVSDMAISDRGFEWIAQLPNLLTLYAKGTGMSRQMFNRFHRKLPLGVWGDYKFDYGSALR